ncbi:hypothetical protein ACFQZJ_06660 [Maribacter chungangensis]|uniref:Delta-aminolevulinic acid dehydratase n=1 Tax=Maribacter chungangensis TaxID=1069117 RepID=A0ABW3B3D3_9FLAO
MRNKMREDLIMIKKYCLHQNLACYDPYDVWMTGLGIKIKQLYNSNKVLGILPAATLTVWDNFVNNKTRFLYKKQEYPAARALAALALLKVYEVNKEEELRVGAKNHIDWLIANTCTGYAGLCWGLGFKWAAGDGLDYNENTPFSTHTPYALEALDRYVELTGDVSYTAHIKSVFNFFETDIQVMFEDGTSMATSYGPAKDRLVTNAVSYAMFAYGIFLKHLPEKRGSITAKIDKLYNFVKGKQRKNGSWLYEPDSEDSFIDCFHSCFVLKNIHKTNLIVPLTDSQAILKIGYNYLISNFYNPKSGLFKRFSLSNKPSIVKYDLYDNAEMLHLAILMKDTDLIQALSGTIAKTFVRTGGIYSVIDMLNLRRNKDTLRWAVMPYLYALSANYKQLLE